MHLAGYFGAVIMGLMLGLIGGGGSILTVPILVYLFGIVPVVATGYSLFVVGFSSLIGFFRYRRQNLVSFKTALIFGIPSIISVYLTRLFFLPWLPDVFFNVNDFAFTKNIGLMVLFALLMIGTSISMIRKNGNSLEEESYELQKGKYLFIILEGTVVGMMTGLVGAGGGFLIVPALVLFSGLPMKTAVGTSLLIIAAKSLIGFLGDVAVTENIDWMFLMNFTALSVVGIIAGNYLSRLVSGKKLKPAFGWFVLVMGIFIIVREVYAQHLF